MIPRIKQSSKTIRLLVTLACVVSVPLSAHVFQIPIAYLQLFGAGDPGSMYIQSLYLPPVPSGPVDPRWSPNGQEIAFSMQGSLWRVPATGGEAVQITCGSSYDSQPTWSPDSKQIAFTRDTGEVINLWVVDIDGQNLQQLTNSQFFTVDPTWSPNGETILYSSIDENRTVGIWTISIKTGLVTPVLTDSYQNITPRWSPDGTAIVLVSNRPWGKRVIQATGGIWIYRLGADEPEILIPEETVWHAHPTWSPDGTKIAYSSIRTGENQLFVASSEAGNPFRITFNDGDSYTPVWSPDGKSLAYISNADNQFTLWTIPAFGGNPSEVKLTSLNYLNPVGRLQVAVRDTGTGNNTPARVYLRASDGKGYTPFGEFHRMVTVTNDHYFHTTGSFQLELPIGEVTVEVMKGFEYRPQTQKVTILADQTSILEFDLNRFINLPERGWFSGDNHIHMNYGGLFLATPKTLMLEADAEDLHVINDLVANYSGVRILDLEYFEGGLHPLSKPNRLLYYNEEYRPTFAGHISLLNLKKFIFPQFNGMEGTALSAHYPPNSHVLDSVHAQGGIGGYVHPYLRDPSLREYPGSDLVKEPRSGWNQEYGGAREFPVNVALRNVDYFDLMSIWSDEFAGEQVWYRTLNLGFRVPASAGSDSMTDYWRHPAIGSVRVYVKTGSSLDYSNWIEAFLEGRSFVTSGPLLSLHVNGAEPGDELTLPVGESLNVQVEAEAASIVPMQTIDIIHNGKVVHTVPLENQYEAKVSIDLPVDRTGWIAARVTGPERQHLLMDSYVYAHTNPVYLVRTGQPARSPEDARYFLEWIDTVLDMITETDRFDTPVQREEVLRLWRKARTVYASLAKDVTSLDQ